MCDLLCCCVLIIPGDEDHYVISEPREAANVPISPLLTIIQADMSTAMGHEGMQLPGLSYQDDISLKSPPALSTGPNNAKPKCRQ